MTLEDAFRIIERVRYRPGWTVEAAQGPSWLQFFFRADVMDAYSITQRTSIQLCPRLELRTLERWARAEFLQYLLEQFLEIERHEAREFFMVGNERPFDPHRSDIRRAGRVNSTRSAVAQKPVSADWYHDATQQHRAE